jgi:hypothetical protein
VVLANGLVSFAVLAQDMLLDRKWGGGEIFEVSGARLAVARPAHPKRLVGARLVVARSARWYDPEPLGGLCRAGIIPEILTGTRGGGTDHVSSAVERR